MKADDKCSLKPSQDEVEIYSEVSWHYFSIIVNPLGVYIYVSVVAMVMSYRIGYEHSVLLVVRCDSRCISLFFLSHFFSHRMLCSSSIFCLFLSLFFDTGCVHFRCASLWLYSLTMYVRISGRRMEIVVPLPRSVVAPIDLSLIIVIPSLSLRDEV